MGPAEIKKKSKPITIFSPFRLGPYQLKNRLIALPVYTGYAYPDGRVSPQLIGNYTKLAQSGAAMVVVANAAVAPDGATSTYSLRVDRDEYIPGLARLARAIKQNGAIACLQLNHAGRFAAFFPGRLERGVFPEVLIGRGALYFHYQFLASAFQIFQFLDHFIVSLLR